MYHLLTDNILYNGTNNHEIHTGTIITKHGTGPTFTAGEERLEKHASCKPRQNLASEHLSEPQMDRTT